MDEVDYRTQRDQRGGGCRNCFSPRKTCLSLRSLCKVTDCLLRHLFRLSVRRLTIPMPCPSAGPRDCVQGALECHVSASSLTLVHIHPLMVF